MLRRLKPVVACCLCLALALTASSAWARSPEDAGLSNLKSAITITGLKPGDVVKATKVVAPGYDQATNELKPQFVNVDVSQSQLASTIQALGKLQDDGYHFDQEADTTAMQQFAYELACHLTQPEGTGGAEVQATGETVKLEGLTPGEYLITVNNEKDVGRVYQNIIANLMPTVTDDGVYQACPDLEILVKSAEVSLDKKVQAKDGSYVDGPVSEYTQGELVPFKVSSTIPRYPSCAQEQDGTEGSFTAAKFWLSDTLSQGLVFQPDSLEVSVSGQTYALTDDKGELNRQVFSQWTHDDHSFKLHFSESFVKAHGNGEVVLTYKAQLVQAPTADKPESNKVVLEYNNNPNSDHTVTKEDQVKLFTFQFSLQKVDAQDFQSPADKSLAGASFKLYRDKDCQQEVITDKGSAVQDLKDGIFAVQGLGAGTYYLKEVKAPSGYQLLPGAIQISVGQDQDGFKLQVVESNVAQLHPEHKDRIVVKNVKQGRLPATGDSGGMLLSLAGAILISADGIYLAHGRKSQ